ncbi:MAG TPA: histidine triad nucleotide-binding protein [Ktedonobacterales bacterium]
MECAFCRIIAGTLPSRMAYQDDTVVAFHDLHPAAPAHVLVVPRRHVSGINDPAAEDGVLLSAMVRAANAVARALGLENGYRLVWNVGPDAGQSVFHLHLHVLGGRSLGWPPG